MAIRGKIAAFIAIITLSWLAGYKCTPVKRFINEQVSTDCVGTDCIVDMNSHYCPIDIQFPENVTNVVVSSFPLIVGFLQNLTSRNMNTTASVLPDVVDLLAKANDFQSTQNHLLGNATDKTTASSAHVIQLLDKTSTTLSDIVSLLREQQEHQNNSQQMLKYTQRDIVNSLRKQQSTQDKIVASLALQSQQSVQLENIVALLQSQKATQDTMLSTLQSQQSTQDNILTLLENSTKAMASFLQNANSEKLTWRVNRVHMQPSSNPLTTISANELVSSAVDCSDIAVQGHHSDGVYAINPVADMDSFDVYCDMEDGGWTVFQRRFDGTESFFRDWNDYQNGFGSIAGEHWLGLIKLHRLTTRENSRWQLKIDLEDFSGNTAYAQYDDFVIGDKSTHFRLTLGMYSGTAGDSLTYHANQGFSTHDQDHDPWTGNCAEQTQGGWWYFSCHRADLNSQYLESVQISSVGIAWWNWKNSYEVLKKVQMKIKRM